MRTGEDVKYLSRTLSLHEKCGWGFPNWSLCLCILISSSDQSCCPQNIASITSCGKESCSSGFSPLSKTTFPCGKCFLETPTDYIIQVSLIVSWLLQSTEAQPLLTKLCQLFLDTLYLFTHSLNFYIPYNN